MVRKIFTSNITWLIFGALSFFIGKAITNVPHSFSGMTDDKMLPFTFIALMNFIMGGYVRAKYHESGADQKAMIKVINWCSAAVCLLLFGWLMKFFI